MDVLVCACDECVGVCFSISSSVFSSLVASNEQERLRTRPGRHRRGRCGQTTIAPRHLGQ